ncbi:MAG: PilZ domain-containing protein [Candidatus Omnitrophica bacterium]|nr:PilZ domain-containing protein [Candidatus Omnitrophota bacterium]
MEEKRRYNRLLVDNKKAVLKEERGTCEVPLLDLSIGGMKVLLDKEVALGEKLSGEFQISPRLGTYFVEGIVIWLKNSLKSTGHEVGIKFERINTISLP